MIERTSIPAGEVVQASPVRAEVGRTLFADASREFRLVAQCCCPAGALPGALRTQGLRWELVLRLAKRHRVEGLVHAALGQRDEVPAEVRAVLGRNAGAIAMANMIALASLVEIGSVFARAAVPFTVMKGLAVGQLAYGNVTTRHSKDLDLLVDPEMVDPACEALVSIGFAKAAASRGVRAQDESRWRRVRKHHDLVNMRTGVHVEVHWRRADNVHFAAPRMQPDRVMMVGGVEMTVPSTTDLLLDLCLHGASHAWFRLKWVADVAALLAQTPADTGTKLLEFAAQNGLERPVEQALLLCSALYPEVVQDLEVKQAALARPSRSGLWLAKVATRALLEETTTSASAEADFVAAGLKRSRLMLRRSWRYRLEEVRVLAASPADWSLVRVPRRLHFAYVLLRVPLWMKRRWIARERVQVQALGGKR